MGTDSQDDSYGGGGGGGWGEGERGRGGQVSGDGLKLDLGCMK